MTTQHQTSSASVNETPVCSPTRVDEFSLGVQQNLQGSHVVVEILKHGRAFAQDAVSREESLLLLQQQGHVVVCVARGEQHSGKKDKTGCSVVMLKSTNNLSQFRFILKVISNSFWVNAYLTIFYNILYNSYLTVGFLD